MSLAPRTWELDLNGTQDNVSPPSTSHPKPLPPGAWLPLPSPGSEPVQVQAFWMCALLHSWLTPSLLTPGPLSCPSLSSFSSSLTIPPSLSCHDPVHSTGQVQSGSFQMPLAICSLPHICSKPLPYIPKSSHVYMFSFIWCHNHRTGIYECLSKGLGCFKPSC